MQLLAAIGAADRHGPRVFHELPDVSASGRRIAPDRYRQVTMTSLDVIVMLTETPEACRGRAFTNCICSLSKIECLLRDLQEVYEFISRRFAFPSRSNRQCEFRETMPWVARSEYTLMPKLKVSATKKKRCLRNTSYITCSLLKRSAE